MPQFTGLAALITALAALVRALGAVPPDRLPIIVIYGCVLMATARVLAIPWW